MGRCFFFTEMVFSKLARLVWTGKRGCSSSLQMRKRQEERPPRWEKSWPAVQFKLHLTLCLFLTTLLCLLQPHTHSYGTFLSLCSQKTFPFPACIKDRTVGANKCTFVSEEEGKHSSCVCAREKRSQITKVVKKNSEERHEKRESRRKK